MNDQISSCGIHCGSCPTFRLDHDKCLGCTWANNMLRIGRENKKGCVFWECAQDKRVENCLKCHDFPCETHYDPKEAIWTKQALDTWKELGKSGMPFWGRRKELEESCEDAPPTKRLNEKRESSPILYRSLQFNSFAQVRSALCSKKVKNRSGFICG